MAATAAQAPSETANNPAGAGGDGGAGVGGGENYTPDGLFMFVQGGGGIYNDGSLNMSASTLSGNGLGAGGDGGSAGAGGQKTTSSGFQDGGRGGYGGPGGLGAGLLEDTGTAQLTNVTIAGNTTGAGGSGGAGPQAGACCGGGIGGIGGYGGGIWDRVANGSSVALTQVTISQNAVGAAGAGGAAGTTPNGAGAPGARGLGAGIFATQYDPGSPGVTETNTIVALNGNPASDANCAQSIGGDIHDGAHNIVYPDASCPGTQADPKLGPLAANGGPTRTMLPGTGSSAINNVPLASCTVSTDQRGDPRPAHGKSSCDSGAVETGTGQPPTKPVNNVLPKITGTTKKGSVLSATKGSWSGKPTKFAYQWEDCNTKGRTCAAIKGATASTHRLVATDVGHTLRVYVRATNSAGTSSSLSGHTAVITP